MSQFKQFWFNNIHYPIIVNNFKDWPKGRPEKRKDLIHVIEYAAYKAAQKEIKQLTAALKVAEEFIKKSHHRDGCAHRYGKDCDCGKFEIKKELG